MNHSEYSGMEERLRTVDEASFEELALDIYHYQIRNNPLYRQFVHMVRGNQFTPTTLEEIVFLPIETFKSHLVQTDEWIPEKVFQSSGTTGMIRSQHAVRSLTSYHEQTIGTFERFFGPLQDVVILALLPNYLQQKNSSLVTMVQAFMDVQPHPLHGFFIDNFAALADRIEHCLQNQYPFILWGVTYALMDFADSFPIPLMDRGLVIETGGMKGRKEEITKTELHSFLKERFLVTTIYAEYGMTELFSQAYTDKEGWFVPASTLQILIGEINDPLVLEKSEKTGLIQVIDLANIHTCSFIATEDLGRARGVNFEVLGRLDHSDLRGCSLLYPS